MAIDLENLRQKLGGAQGRRYWRSLEELAQTEEFRQYLEKEFPEQAPLWTNPITRRQFLTLMGASLALAGGVAGCSAKTAPAEKIMPYVDPPEDALPGRPLYYATAMTIGGIASGILVESHEGRPTKIEGNPDHPACTSKNKFGPTDLFAQASILDLYDPDRSQAITYNGRPRAWNEFLAALQKDLRRQRQKKGSGLRILTQDDSSPTLIWQLQAIRKEFPDCQWHHYEPLARPEAAAGGRQAFGEAVTAIYDFRNADIVLSLDADFLSSGPGYLRNVRDFSERHRVWTTEPDQAKMNRLYVVEGTPSTTGAKADHRLRMRAGDIESLSRLLAMELGLQAAPGPDIGSTWDRQWLKALVQDLKEHRGRCLILAGDGQPARVHALVHALNDALGNVGKTVLSTEPIDADSVGQAKSLKELTEDMNARDVEVLLILGGNPVYTAPADIPFAEALEKVPRRIHLGLYQDETALRCHWHIPQTHYLEAWSDARAFDGTASIQQPLIAPLYPNARSVHEFLAALLDQPSQVGHDLVRDYWRGHWPKDNQAADFEAGWEKALHDGFLAGTTSPSKSVTLKKDWDVPPPASSSGDLEIVFRADPTLYDGRFANNGWLQELPKPITKLTWGNAALISPATAIKLRLSENGEPGTPGNNGGEHGQVFVREVELHYRNHDPIRMPLWITPGHADDSVTVFLGHGRTQAGQVGTGVGVNVYPLRDSTAPWFDTGLTLKATGKQAELACTQMHHLVPSRHPVDSASLATYQKHPHFAKHLEGEEAEPNVTDRRLVPLTLYPEHDYPGYKWGMAIDLGACTGCMACVVACQAENNIPVVGKEEVLRGREMHWLRIDRYYEGDLDDPATHFQPVPCMHCENAPCELVCPVGATVHSDDGLNDMVYNRCVGTRYCSNNCPYKVRRFNFLEYADYATESLKLLHNPEVTVRSRGVMEKCTYCVQRIRAAEIDAKNEKRTDPTRPGVAPIRDGEILTACQAACPAQAIVFGDLNDPKALATRMKAQPLNYGLLASLNTRPRTTYLAAVNNPNPDLLKNE